MHRDPKKHGLILLIAGIILVMWGVHDVNSQIQEGLERIVPSIFATLGSPPALVVGIVYLLMGERAVAKFGDPKARDPRVLILAMPALLVGLLVDWGLQRWLNG